MWLRPDPARQSAKPRLPTSEINVIDLLCPIALLCLEYHQIGSVELQGLLQQTGAGHGEPFTRGKDPQRAHWFQSTLRDLLPELELLAAGRRLCSGLVFSDQLVRGLRHIGKAGPVRVCMVASCHRYLRSTGKEHQQRRA